MRVPGKLARVAHEHQLSKFVASVVGWAQEAYERLKAIIAHVNMIVSSFQSEKFISEADSFLGYEESRAAAAAAEGGGASHARRQGSGGACSGNWAASSACCCCCCCWWRCCRRCRCHFHLQQDRGYELGCRFCCVAHRLLVVPLLSQA